MSERGRPPIPLDDLLDDIDRVAREVNRRPTLDDYNEHGQYSATTVYRHCGSWADAVELALSRDTVTRLQLLADLRRVDTVTDGHVTTRTYKQRGRWSSKTYLSRFGSWVAALDAAGIGVSERQRRASVSNQHSYISLLEETDPEDLGLSPLGERARDGGAQSP